MKNEKELKTIKSFKDFKNVKRRDLFSYNADKGEYSLKKIDPKVIVSMAKQISEGFNIDLRKPPTASQNKRARKVVSEFFDGYQQKKSRIVRPSKKNRGAYAASAGTSKRFKIYALPDIKEGAKVKYKVKNGKLIHLIGKTKNIPYLFEELDDFDVEDFALNNAGKYVKKLLKKARKENPLKDDETVQFKMITGKDTNEFWLPQIDDKPVVDMVKNLMTKYDNYRDWMRGVKATVFSDQKPLPKKYKKKTRKTRK